MTQRELMMLVAEAAGFAVANRNDGEKIDLAAIVDRILAEHEGWDGHIATEDEADQLHIAYMSGIEFGKKIAKERE